MRNSILIISGILISFGLGFYFNTSKREQTGNDSGKSDLKTTIENEEKMKLGAFSVSLSVKDLKTSKEFYEKLGFTFFAGGQEKNYLIMKNENSLIGLFHGMFEGNILTFNPGWDENAGNIEKFDDVREIQKQLKGKGVKIDNEVDEKTTGPAGFMITDPDGNIILIDQHR
jgi:catechol 2,3-dioxygenase-like lactoylglutathione lyase family enzyme